MSTRLAQGRQDHVVCKRYVYRSTPVEMHLGMRPFADIILHWESQAVPGRFLWPAPAAAHTHTHEGVTRQRYSTTSMLACHNITSIQRTQAIVYVSQNSPGPMLLSACHLRPFSVQDLYTGFDNARFSASQLKAIWLTGNAASAYWLRQTCRYSTLRRTLVQNTVLMPRTYLQSNCESGRCDPTVILI